MRKAIVAGLAFGALLGPAAAADLYVKAPPPAPCIWCGFYIGANAGYGWSSDSETVAGSPIYANPLAPAGTVPSLAAAVTGVGGSFGAKSDGFIGGGQAGYNWQFNSIVAGFETDIQGGSMSSSANGASAVAVAGFPGTFVNSAVSVSEKLNYLGTVRARLGITVTPTTLFYATGGLAYGGVSSTTNIGQQEVGAGAATVNAPYGAVSSSSGTHTGWTAGGGVEWMAARPWSVKLEYLHYDLGSASSNATLSNIVIPPGGAVPTGGVFYTLGAASSRNITGDIVRVGVNYKFGY
jgi:outer membrane immunogenic protein